jgi:hypothetical protein
MIKSSPITFSIPGEQRSNTPLGLIPLVVASTGHRHFPVEDTPKLEASVTEVLLTLAGKSPYSPTWLLNGLAEGADRLIARCALNLGWEVHAVIPVSQSRFESTMSSEDARREFRDLLRECASINIVLLSSSEPDQMYLDVANVLCVQGQWLIALWDGKIENGPGGTGWVVQQFQEGIANNECTLPDTGPVIHIHTRRSVSDVLTFPIGYIYGTRHPQPLGLTQHQGVGAQWERVANLISDFNKDAIRCLGNEALVLDKIRADLGGVPPSHQASSINDLDRLGWIYAVADLLALRYQSRRKTYFLWMLFWSVLAITFEQLYSGPLDNTFGVLAIAVLAAVFAILPVALRSKTFGYGGRVEANYLDYRALAEACRVQYYWRLTGIFDSAADAYLSEQRDEIEWIRQAIRSTDISVNQTIPASSDAIAFVQHKWISEQRQYFIGGHGCKNRAAGYQKISSRFDLVIMSLLLLAVLSLSIAILMHVTKSTEFLPLVQMSWGVCLGAAGSIKLYQRTLAFSENARRYALMGVQAATAETLLNDEQRKSVPNLDTCRRILKSYGNAALQETSYWLLLLRARPAGPTIGG